MLHRLLHLALFMLHDTLNQSNPGTLPAVRVIAVCSILIDYSICDQNSISSIDVCLFHVFDITFSSAGNILRVLEMLGGNVSCPLQGKFAK